MRENPFNTSFFTTELVHKVDAFLQKTGSFNNSDLANNWLRSYVVCVLLLGRSLLEIGSRHPVLLDNFLIDFDWRWWVPRCTILRKLFISFQICACASPSGSCVLALKRGCLLVPRDDIHQSGARDNPVPIRYFGSLSLVLPPLVHSSN
jgi:hypothetical protein